MLHFESATMNLEFFGEVSIYLGLGIQIVASLILGGIVGYDREVKSKAAGLKTNIMICIGATLYTSISMLNIASHPASGVIDPNRLSAQIVSGIGFLGAGAIIQGRGSVTGLTTAATIWVVAAIGYTIGVGYPFVAFLFSLTVLVVLRLVNPINTLIERKADYRLFHFELLSFGNLKGAIEHYIAQEDIATLFIKEEPHPVYEGQYHLDIYLKGHNRAVERLYAHIHDAIRVKKVNYAEIHNLPDHLLQVVAPSNFSNKKSSPGND